MEIRRHLTALNSIPFIIHLSEWTVCQTYSFVREYWSWYNRGSKRIDVLKCISLVLKCISLVPNSDRIFQWYNRPPCLCDTLTYLKPRNTKFIYMSSLHTYRNILFRQDASLNMVVDMKGSKKIYSCIVYYKNEII